MSNFPRSHARAMCWYSSGRAQSYPPPRCADVATSPGCGRSARGRGTARGECAVSSPDRTGPGTPREARRPLLEEGGHTFGAVRGAGGDRLVTRLHVENVLERHAESLVESRLGQSVHHGRALGQPLGELQRLLLELLRRDHAADEADPQRLLRVDDVSEQDQLHGLGRPDEAWEEVRPPAVRHETHAREDLTEARRVGRDTEIGGQGDVHAGSRGHAVDAADNGLPQPLHAEDAAVQALDERSPEIALEERCWALAATLLIAA